MPLPPETLLAMLGLEGASPEDGRALAHMVGDIAKNRAADRTYTDSEAASGSSVALDVGANDLQVTAEEPGRYVTPEGTSAAILGAGGMGTVALVRDRVLRRDVALKELHRTAGQQRGPSSGSPNMVDRFLREARVTACLEHPNIVPVHELGRRPDGTLYYTMRHIRGRSLQSAISACPTLDARLRLLPHFTDLCNAIAFAHSRGVTHRDLKPANVMVGEFGETVVVDWGLAGLAGDRAVPAPDSSGAELVLQNSGVTRAGSVMGTPAYMSPEQAQGAAGAPSDVWSLGAILFEILTGRPPYVGTDGRALLAMAAAGVVPDPVALAPGVPPELAAVAARAMRRVPEERYSTAAELSADVEAWRDARRVNAHDYTLGEAVRRFVRRHRRPVTVAGVALTVLAAVLVVAFVKVGAERDRALTAETRATAALTMETRAVAETHERLVRTNIDAGTKKLLANDPIGALPYLATALQLVEGEPRERDARIRLSATLDSLPKLIAVVAGTAVPSPDGVSLAEVTAGRVRVVDVASGATVREAPIAGVSEGDAAAWSHDGSRLAVITGQELRMIRATDLALLWGPVGSGSRVRFWEDDRSVVAWDRASDLRSFDAATGAPDRGRSTVVDSADGVTARRDPDRPGDLLVGRAGRRATRVTTLESTYQPARLNGTGSRLTAMMLPGRLGVWDVAAGSLEAVLADDAFLRTEFDPSGAYLLTGARSHTVGVWSPAGAPLGPPITLDSPIQDLHAARGGRFTVLSAELTRLFELRASVLAERQSLDVSRDGSTALVEQAGELIWLHGADVVSQERSPCASSSTGKARWGHMDVEGRYAHLLCSDVGYIVAPNRAPRALVTALPRWSPTGSVLASRDPQAQAHLWDPEAGTRVAPAPGDSVGWLADGSLVVADDTSTSAVDPITGTVHWTLPGQVLSSVTSLGATGDIAGITESGGLLVRRAGDLDVGPPTFPYCHVAASTDGGRIAVGCVDGTVRILDGNTLASIGVPLATKEWVGALGFTADGAHVVATGYFLDERFVVSAATGELVALVPNRNRERAPSVDPSGVAHLWDLEPDDRPVAEWLDIAAVYSSLRSTPGGVVAVSAAEVLDLARTLANRSILLSRP